MRFRVLLIALLLLAGTVLCYAQPVLNDYRSVATEGGNSKPFWANIDAWERFDGTNWLDATVVPTSANNVTIRSGYPMTIESGSNAVCKNLVIDTGAKLNTKATGTVAALVISGDYTNKGSFQSLTGQGNSSLIQFSADVTHKIYGSGAIAGNGIINFAVNAGTTSTPTVLIFDSDAQISGTSTFTTGANTVIETASDAGLGSTTVAGGSISYPRTATFDASTDFVFNGTSDQVTGTKLPATVDDVTINNAAGVTLSNTTVISGTLTQTAGTLTNNNQVDGYSSFNLNFPQTGTNLAAFVASSTYVDHGIDYIDREWTITSTTTTAPKTVTFSWSSDEDGNYPWSSTDVPAVFVNGVEYTGTGISYDFTTDSRTITIPMSTFNGTTITVGRAGGGTLPVELSSFTAQISSMNYVQLIWITQSETNVAGFRIYRNTSDDLETAEMLNTFINATNTSQTQVYIYTDEDLQGDGTYYYWLQNLDLDGSFTFHGPTTITINGHEQGIPPVPVVLGINNAYPNPFNPSLTLKYGITKRGNAELTIFNQRGQLVRNLYSGNREIGSYSLVWDGRDNSGRELPSGVYLIRLQTPGKAFSHKVVLLK